ncbi:hypothetical protein Acsp02_06950 [Actinoplanes sp. NBRC 103695]|nr:hypothetical protein Acsp02_06950 [Actinoplanes sp. NBRC 103695]
MEIRGSRPGATPAKRREEVRVFADPDPPRQDRRPPPPTPGGGRRIQPALSGRVWLWGSSRTRPTVSPLRFFLRSAAIFIGCDVH